MDIEQWTDERLDRLANSVNQLAEGQKRIEEAMLAYVKQQTTISQMIARLLDSQSFLLDSQNKTNDVVEKEQHLIERQQDIIERQQETLDSFDETVFHLDAALASTNAGVARLEKIIDFLIKNKQ
ncbi:MAG TPA: hypothetical protein V6D13_12200 [Halomicronema sp.]